MDCVSVCPVLNCVRLLTRILAYIFEDPDWRGFFWSTLPRQTADESTEVMVHACVTYRAINDEKTRDRN